MPDSDKPELIYPGRSWLHRNRAVYVRSHQLSLELASRGIVHHYEVHTLQPIIARGQLQPILCCHLRGLIDRFIPISHSAARALIEAGADTQCIHVSPSGVDLSIDETILPLDSDRTACVCATSGHSGVDLTMQNPLPGVVVMKSHREALELGTSVVAKGCARAC